MELNYKRLYFLYLTTIGWMILGYNEVFIAEIVPMSVIVLITHGIYIIALGLLNPYKMSLRVHTVGLWLCQIVYFIFLVFINLINFT